MSPPQNTTTAVGLVLGGSENPTAATPTLTITDVGPADAGRYSGQVYTDSPCFAFDFINRVRLTICVADTDVGNGTGICDGGVTIDDLLYYLFIFENGDLTADVDDGSSSGTPDGGVTIDDLLYFLLRFEAGC